MRDHEGERKDGPGGAEFPPGVVAWLAKFKLLLGVPFQYLVPDERLLPAESLRFFSMDEGWIDALIDGALSVGRSYTAAAATDVAPSLHLERAHRRLHGHTNGGLHSHRRAQLMQEPAPAGPASFPPISGFLLRSAVVTGFPGLEIMAYEQGKSPYEYQQRLIAADQVRPMTALRLEPLSRSVILGLFVGRLYELVIHQPPEAVHFGFSRVDAASGTVHKTLRVPRKTWSDPQGYDGETHRDVALDDVFADPSRRVLGMARVAKAMAQKLAAPEIDRAPGYYQPKPDGEHRDGLLSSDFALEMVHAVGLVSFIHHPQDRRG